jgi:hypothetical protein
MFSQLPTAIDALSRAVMAADAAVDEAAEQGEPVSGLAGRLDVVKGQGDVAVRRAESSAMTQQFPVVSEGTRDAIHAAVDDSQDVLAQPTVVSPTPTTTTEPPPATAPPATEPPPATAPPPTEPPATAPSSTADSGETPGSVDSQAAPDGWTLDEVSPASVAGP